MAKPKSLAVHLHGKDIAPDVEICCFRMYSAIQLGAIILPSFKYPEFRIHQRDATKLPIPIDKCPWCSTEAVVDVRYVTEEE